MLGPERNKCMWVLSVYREKLKGLLHVCCTPNFLLMEVVPSVDTLRKITLILHHVIMLHSPQLIDQWITLTKDMDLEVRKKWKVTNFWDDPECECCILLSYGVLYWMVIDWANNFLTWVGVQISDRDIEIIFKEW